MSKMNEESPSGPISQLNPVELIGSSELRAEGATPNAGPIRQMLLVAYSQGKGEEIPGVVVRHVVVTYPELVDVDTKPLTSEKHVSGEIQFSGSTVNVPFS